MKENHKFQSFRKKYGRYQIHMTQHMFVGNGRKRYGPINWVIYLDDEHIVLNTYIKDHKSKINEGFLDDHWNIFVMKYNYNIDVWSMAEDNSIDKFNDYRECLMPDKSNLTLTDFDNAMAKVEEIENNRKNTLRKLKKVSDNISKIEKGILSKVDEMRREIDHIRSFLNE